MKHYFIEVKISDKKDCEEFYRYIIEEKNMKEAKEVAIIRAIETWANDEGCYSKVVITDCYQTSAEASVD